MSEEAESLVQKMEEAIVRVPITAETLATAGAELRTRYMQEVTPAMWCDADVARLRVRLAELEAEVARLTGMLCGKLSVSCADAMAVMALSKSTADGEESNTVPSGEVMTNGSSSQYAIWRAMYAQNPILKLMMESDVGPSALRHEDEADRLWAITQDIAKGA